MRTEQGEGVVRVGEEEEEEEAAEEEEEELVVVVAVPGWIGKGSGHHLEQKPGQECPCGGLDAQGLSHH